MKKGFSLIELLVVIAIISVLSTVGLASFQNTAKGGRDGRRKGDLSQVRAALELYRSQNNSYPAGPYGGVSSGMLKTIKDAGYISEPVPQDPKNVAPYTYAYSVSGATYCLCAHLEVVGTGNASSSSCAGTSGDYYCATQP